MVYNFDILYTLMNSPLITFFVLKSTLHQCRILVTADNDRKNGTKNLGNMFNKKVIINCHKFNITYEMF